MNAIKGFIFRYLRLRPKLLLLTFPRVKHYRSCTDSLFYSVMHSIHGTVNYQFQTDHGKFKIERCWDAIEISVDRISTSATILLKTYLPLRCLGVQSERWPRLCYCMLDLEKIFGRRQRCMQSTSTIVSLHTSRTRRKAYVSI